MKHIKIRTLWVLLLQLVIGAQIVLAQSQYHPDRIYPIPYNYGEVNESGINLFTGDLNLEVPLASLSGKNLSYSLNAFYNSRSVAVPSSISPAVDNALGGKGWKLMDYPKITKSDYMYYYLDGQKAYNLRSVGSSSNYPYTYMSSGAYYLWRFIQNSATSWTIITESGIRYHVTNTHTIEGNYPVWSLSQIEDSDWGETIDFNYSNGRLNSISSSLGDQLQLVYDDLGHLSQIDIYHDRETDNKHAIARDQTVIRYNGLGITAIESKHQLPTGFFSETAPALTFTYDAQGRVYQMISPSGAVQSYKYYTGSSHSELAGAVIRYSTDNGYRNITGGTEGQAHQADLDATYSALWYDLGNVATDYTGVYHRYNVVRVYPGGFRTNDPNQYNNTSQLKDPFGHQTYYFFNAPTSQYSLIGLPADYDHAPGGLVTSPLLAGMLYKVESYNDQSLTENAASRIMQHQSIYKLEDYTEGNNSVSFPLLEKEISSSDGIDAVNTWYEYYGNSDYYLPKAIIYSRLNPKENNPNYREYEKHTRRYAFQDYTALRNKRIITPSSQSYTEVAPYSGSTLPNSSSLQWKITDAEISRWKNWKSNNSAWAPYESYVQKDELTAGSLPLNLSNSINASQWMKMGEALTLNTNGLTTLSEDIDQLRSSVIYDDIYQLYPIAGFDNVNVNSNQAGYFGFEVYESASKWNVSGGNYTRSDAHTGGYTYGNSSNSTVRVRAQNYSPKSGSKYVIGAFVKNKGGSTGKIGFKRSSTWVVSKNIPVNASEWQYVSVVMTSPASNALPHCGMQQLPD